MQHLTLNLLLASLLSLSACNSSITSSSQSSPSPQPGLLISATPIRLVIPPGLAVSASADTVDVVTENTGAPWDAAPAHLQLTFQDYALQTTFHVAQIFLYPTQQYAALNPTAAESIRRLQGIVSEPSVSHDKDSLPRVPFYNSRQVFAAQEKLLHFSGGSGVRFITQYGQYVAPVNNNAIFYHFQGFSNGGNYYILAVLPVNLPFLSADSQLDSPIPPGGLPFPPASASPAQFNDYYEQITARINAASSDQFSPSLHTLDALMQSLSVSP